MLLAFLTCQDGCCQRRPACPGFEGFVPTMPIRRHRGFPKEDEVMLTVHLVIKVNRLVLEVQLKIVLTNWKFAYNRRTSILPI